MSVNGDGNKPKQTRVNFPPGTPPIDKLWWIMNKWGIVRTFEDGSQVINVILRKDELDNMVRQCYGVTVKKGG